MSFLCCFKKQSKPPVPEQRTGKTVKSIDDFSHHATLDSEESLSQATFRSSTLDRAVSNTTVNSTSVIQSKASQLPPLQSDADPRTTVRSLVQRTTLLVQTTGVDGVLEGNYGDVISFCEIIRSDDSAPEATVAVLEESLGSADPNEVFAALYYMDVAVKTFNNPKGKAAQNGPLHNIVNIISSESWVQKLQKLGSSELVKSEVVKAQLRVCLPQWTSAVETSPAVAPQIRSRATSAFQQVESGLRLQFDDDATNEAPQVSFGGALLKSSAGYALPSSQAPGLNVDLGQIQYVSPEEEQQRRTQQRQEVALTTLRKQQEAQERALEEDIRVATAMSLNSINNAPIAAPEEEHLQLEAVLEMSRIEAEQQFKEAQKLAQVNPSEQHAGTSGTNGTAPTVETKTGASPLHEPSEHLDMGIDLELNTNADITTAQENYTAGTGMIVEEPVALSYETFSEQVENRKADLARVEDNNADLVHVEDVIADLAHVGDHKADLVNVKDGIPDLAHVEDHASNLPHVEDGTVGLAHAADRTAEQAYAEDRILHMFCTPEREFPEDQVADLRDFDADMHGELNAFMQKPLQDTSSVGTGPSAVPIYQPDPKLNNSSVPAPVTEKRLNAAESPVYFDANESEEEQDEWLDAKFGTSKNEFQSVASQFEPVTFPGHSP